MNILFVLQEIPQSHTTGAWQRTYLLWEALKQIGNVYAVYFDNQKDNCPENDYMKRIRMHKISRVLHYKIIAPLHSIRSIEFTPLKPLTQKAIKDFFPSVHFDLMVCRYVHNFAKYHLWDMGIPVLIDIDDHPLQVFDTIEQNNVPKWLQVFARVVIQRQMKYLEKKTSGLWIADPQHHQLLYNKSNVCLLRNIAPSPSAQYMRSPISKNYLLTVGTMGYPPNYKGVTRFLETIWPTFHQEHPNIEYLIVGKDAPLDLAAKWNATPNVKYLGYVDNLEALYSECLATVVPIDGGSGTCIKTLESLSYCVPCLTTEFGCRGMEYNDSMENIGLYLYRNAQDFTEAFAKITDSKEIDKQQERMKHYIADKYTKEQFFASVKELVSKVITSE